MSPVGKKLMSGSVVKVRVYGYILLFCSVHMASVCPGRGISPLWLFLRFLPSFFLFNRFRFFSSLESRDRTEGVVPCTDFKAH